MTEALQLGVGSRYVRASKLKCPLYYTNPPPVYSATGLLCTLCRPAIPCLNIDSKDWPKALFANNRFAMGYSHDCKAMNDLGQWFTSLMGLVLWIRAIVEIAYSSPYVNRCSRSRMFSKPVLPYLFVVLPLYATITQISESLGMF